MTYSKEELTMAFAQVMNERIPPLDDMPDHVFSERFEKRMNKLIAREAAHPWAVSHIAVRNALLAALIALLLFMLSLSVSGVRSALYNFFTRHFDTYDEVVFDDTERTEIEHVYKLTSLPEGFKLVHFFSDNGNVIWQYEAQNSQWIKFTQKVPIRDGNAVINNEDAEISSLQIDDQIVLFYEDENGYLLAWEENGYEFWLEINIPYFTKEQVIQLYRSIN